MSDGRPLRFLVATLGGWTLARTAILWPTLGPLPALLGAAAPPAAARASARPMVARLVQEYRPHAVTAAVRLRDVNAAVVAPHPSYTLGEYRRARIAMALAALVRFGEPYQPGMARRGALIPGPPRALPLAAPRLSGSGWLLLRGGGAPGEAPFGGQLGGAQAGARLTYALGDSRRLALAGRLSTPLSGRGREASLGIEWRPTGLPLRVVAEQRFGLDGTPGGPALGVIGGAGPLPLGAHFRLEAYGQMGAIARDRVEGFADGAVRIARPVATLGGFALDLGVGAWGGAQRDAARLDVGPSLGLTMPVGDRRLRLSLDCGIM